MAIGVSLRHHDPETRYKDSVRREQKMLEDFAAHEIEYADDLLLWYRAKRLDMPDDVYRAAAFFLNKEYLHKPGSLTLLYTMYHTLRETLPAPTKENAFDLLTYRFRVYAAALSKGGY
jgi:hypothetical protein